MAKLKRKLKAQSEASTEKILDERPAEDEPPKKVKIKQKKQKERKATANNEEIEATPAEIPENPDGDMYEPTMAELKESEKPENNLAIVTGRQKKRQKHQQRLEEQKGHNADKEKQRNEEYLTKWKNDRAAWKFEKLRQISIQLTVFEEDKISPEVWPLALEYLSGSKGAAKEKIMKLAEDIIDKLDEACEKLEDDEEKRKIIDSVKYQRARDMLQSFD